MFCTFTTDVLSTENIGEFWGGYLEVLGCRIHDKCNAPSLEEMLPEGQRRENEAQMEVGSFINLYLKVCYRLSNINSFMKALLEARKKVVWF